MNQFGLGDLVESIGYVKHEEAIEYMCSSHILLLIIPDVINNEGILTGKLFEYLAASRPILFLGPEKGDAAKIIAETNSGLICNYNDSTKIADSIVSLLNENTAFKSINVGKYSRENLTKHLITIINNL